MNVELGPGVADLVWRVGEAAITVEMTIDFEHDVTKHAVAFVGASEPGLGYECIAVDGVDVWWRQRLLTVWDPKVTSRIRPRRLVVERVVRALTRSVQYESLRI